MRTTKYVRIRMDFVLHYAEEMTSIPDHITTQQIGDLFAALRALFKQKCQNMPDNERPIALGDGHFQVNLDMRKRLPVEPKRRRKKA